MVLVTIPVCAVEHEPINLEEVEPKEIMYTDAQMAVRLASQKPCNSILSGLWREEKTGKKTETTTGKNAEESSKQEQTNSDDDLSKILEGDQSDVTKNEVKNDEANTVKSETGKVREYSWCAGNNPCRNNGTCMESEQHIFLRCVCLSEDHDETNYCIKREEPNLCQNGGVYVRLDVGFDCKCLARFHGRYCEVDKCAACSPDANCRCDGKCVCKEGYRGTGYQCEKDPVYCLGILCDANTMCTNGVCR